MDKLPTPDEIAERAQAAGLSIVRMCAAAGVAPSTFHRWRSGETSPSFATVMCMVVAIANAEMAPEKPGENGVAGVSARSMATRLRRRRQA